MSNLKILKNRIRSVKSTQKITKAMKMVSAAKLRRAREKLEANQPYYKALENMCKNLIASCDLTENTSTVLKKLLNGTDKDNKYLIVITSSDRGLCGGFNSSIYKSARKFIHEISSIGKSFDVIVLGTKGYQLAKGLYSNKILYKKDGLGSKTLTYDSVTEVVDKITDMYINYNYDKVIVFYNEFKSVISQIPRSLQLLPFSDSKASETNNEEFEFEPAQDLILEKLISKTISSRLFHILLENATSEQGARMSAMDNATRNAGEMISNLTLEYNRSRQALITKELIEIISGAEAI